MAMSKIKRLAIIPARGGSKRIPDKNIKLFCGQPIISYILNVASESLLFDKIHVSTDSFHIREVVEQLGFSIDFMRPKELADDFTPLMPVLKFVRETYALLGNEFDEIWLLMACSPLIETDDLVNAAALFEKTDKSYALLGVAEYPVPIDWAFQMNNTGVIKPVKPGIFSVRSQDMPKYYFDAGVLTVYTSLAILSSEGAGSDANFVGFVIPKHKAIDIDDEVDWLIAEAMYNFKK